MNPATPTVPFPDPALLIDGAMATNLFARGLALTAAPEAWTLTRPEDVEALHRAFVDAGADIVLTNSFGGHPRRLRQHGLADQAMAINGAAARVARAAIRDAGRPILVAGAVGPTGDASVGFEAEAGFTMQMQALADHGVDLFWIETMSYPDEIRLAARAAAALHRPYVLTASFGPDGRTLGGLNAAGFARLAAALPVRPAAIGANCGAGLAPLLRDLAAMRRVDPDSRLVAKASAGWPDRRGERLIYPLAPADMAAYATEALATGASLIGGCCGTTPAHVAAMRGALRDALAPDGHAA